MRTSGPRAVDILATPHPAEAVTDHVQVLLEEARAIVQRIAAEDTPRTVESTLEALNRVQVLASNGENLAGLMEHVHPQREVRDAAERGSQEVKAFVSALFLDPRLYAAVENVDVSAADDATRRMHEHTLRDFRRAGVSKDEATRGRIRELRDDLVLIGQEFERNIREGKRFVEFDRPEDLEGLPADYLEGHPADERGAVRISTDYPDYLPFVTYARSEGARRRMNLAFSNVGHPDNDAVLARMLTKRRELARLLGYADWSAYATEDKMTRTPEAVEAFLAGLDEATAEPSTRDLAELLARKRRDDPAATVVGEWDRFFYLEKTRAERHAFDPEEVRAYLPYRSVMRGVLDLYAELFDVSFHRVEDAWAWHPTVEVYEVREGGTTIGWFYLDMHPREGKFNHAAQFALVTGIRGVQLPEAALVCNLPDPSTGGSALMEHYEVETVFHEFGHLLHHIFGGNQPWARFSGVATEWDFVEAPSQLLEEWTLDTPTLQRFARHHRTGQPIPAVLVAKLRAAKDFGKGALVRRQGFFAALSHRLHTELPEGLDLEGLFRAIEEVWSPFRYPEGAHLWGGFGHLEGYSSIYYTYTWSLVIAKDLFTGFDRANMLDPAAARRYRTAVLDPGGSRDAADLVEDFLGRPHDDRAFAAWLASPGRRS
jgi:thimet oligopeptidase